MTGEKLFTLFPFAPRSYRMHPFTLFFAEEVEKEYRRESQEENLNYIRTAGLLAAIAYLIIALVEPFWSEPETIRFSLTIRLGLVMPIIILFIFSTFSKRLSVLSPHLLQLALIVIALVQFLLNVRNYPNIPVPIGDAYIILIFMSFSLLRTSFMRSVIIAIFVLILVLLETILIDISPQLRLFDFLIILSAVFMGGFVGYAVEYYQRQDWLLKKQAIRDKKLEIETAKLRTVQELARTVAHEFNNPLSVIQAVYDLRLRVPRPDETTDERRDYERIPRTVERMSELAKKLLTITEIHQAEYLKGINYIDLHKQLTLGPDEPDLSSRPVDESPENPPPSE